MKNALITGGTKGLGKALAFELGRRDYSVIALYRADKTAATAAQSEFQEAGLTVQVIQQDVTLPEASLELKSAIASRTGSWSLLHCATPPFEPKPMRLVSQESVLAQLATSVWGLELCTRALMPSFAKHGGAIVSILSEVVQKPQRGFAAYAASKAAIAGWSRCAAQELSALAVKVFTVSPGFMDTELTRAWGPHVRQAMLSQTVSSANSVAAQIRSRLEDPSVEGLGEDYNVA